tara:strand:- start:552 stop:1325 length:774 start_codon:yes stop_codon:yes gene_type:complete
MKFIDTHSHLYSKEFDLDRSETVKRALNAGVEKILLPNISSKYTNSMLQLCVDFPKNCLPMMGLHPCDVKEETYLNELLHIEKEIKQKKYIAVGEIGIDLFWEKSNLELQKTVFTKQINLAKKYNLPIVIHVRESFNEVITIVEKLNDTNLKGVFHCFTGNTKDAKRIVDLGSFYLGIGGVLTFKNSNLDKTIEKISLNHLLLETDSPYLTPSPYRGKRNESKYIIEIAEKLSKIKNCSMSKIADITTNNAKELFRL